MDCRECLQVFTDIGNAFNSPIKTAPLLQVVSETLWQYGEVARN